MKWVGYKQVAIESIVADAPDIKARAKEAHVVELANDIRTAGEEPIHAPTIRQGSNDLLCGRDRFAALLALKAKRIWVHVADCDDREAKELEFRENIYRRPSVNRAGMLAELVALKEQEIRASEPEARGNSVTPSAQTVKAAARKEVARAAGVTPAAVKRAEQRAKAPDPVAEAEPAPAQDVELPRGFETFGLSMTEAEKAQARGVMENMAAWAAQATGLQTYLGRFGKGSAVNPAHLEKIRACLQALGHAYRDAIPVRLCFYCKARPDLKPNCHACGQTGLMGRNDGESAPAELKAKKPVAVAAGGKFVPYSDAEAVAKPEKAVKRVSVVIEPTPVTPGDDEVPF